MVVYFHCNWCHKAPANRHDPGAADQSPKARLSTCREGVSPMVRHVRRIAPLLLALAAAGIWLAPATEAKEPHPVVQLAKKLAEPVDFPGIDDPKTTLQEVLELLAQKNGVRFDINEKAFQAEMGGLAGVKAPRRGDPDLAL